MYNIAAMLTEQVIREDAVWGSSVSKSSNLARYGSTVKPVYNDHLYNKMNYLWFIQ